MKIIKIILSVFLVFVIAQSFLVLAWVPETYPFSLHEQTMQPKQNYYSRFSNFVNQSRTEILNPVVFSPKSIYFNVENTFSSLTNAHYSYQRIESFSSLNTLDDQTGFTVELKLKLNQTPLNTLNDTKVGQTGFILNVRSAALNREMYISIVPYDGKILITSYTGNRGGINQTICEKIWYDTYDPNKENEYVFEYDRAITNRIIVWIKPYGSNVYECVGTFSEPTTRTSSMSYYNQDFVMVSSVNRGINAENRGGQYKAIYKNEISSLSVAKGALFVNNKPSSSYWIDSNRYKMVGGIGSTNNPKTYWVDSASITSTVHSKIRGAWNDWMDASDWNLESPVNVTETSDYTTSKFDFYMEDLSSLGENTIGHAYMYNGLEVVNNEELGGFNNNWTWARIKLDDNLLMAEVDSDVDLDYPKQTIGHEIGHTLGLLHATSAGETIMFDRRDFMLNVDRPTLGDYLGLYDLYELA